jgi:hypothetical protein
MNTIAPALRLGFFCLGIGSERIKKAHLRLLPFGGILRRCTVSESLCINIRRWRDFPRGGRKVFAEFCGKIKLPTQLFESFTVSAVFFTGTEPPIKLYYSQTLVLRVFNCAKFETPIKLYYSQTAALTLVAAV